MKEQYTILIADRNSHVRELLKREMESEGYRVQLAGNGSEALKRAFGPDFPHLVIIDPDLPDSDEMDILNKLEDRIPALPLIIHAFTSEYNESPAVPRAAVFVEKRGKSVERLKEVAAVMLQKANPRHTGALEGKKPLQGGDRHETQ